MDAENRPKLPCLNCDVELTLSLPPGSLFCSEICRSRADTVRYGRRIFRDGRISDPLVADAFTIKMAFAVTDGGYPAAQRELKPEIRATVIERDGGKCVFCGNPGTEIDHILTGSPELDNLQLLCHDCHMRKSQENLRPIEAGSQAELVWQEIMARIHAPEPLRVCDDEIGWATTWRELAKARRALRTRAATTNS